jgi:hypothetical protein
MTISDDKGVDEAHWTGWFDTSAVDPTAVHHEMMRRRYVFGDAKTIANEADMAQFLRQRFGLSAIAATELPPEARRTREIEEIAQRRRYQKLPLWLAVAIAGTLDQIALPSPYVILMHQPVYVPQRGDGRPRARVLALAEGKRELIVTAPRVSSYDQWDADRTFLYLSQ